MTNIILFVCCVSAGLLCGAHFKRKFAGREALFADMVRYAELLQLNISGRQLELEQFNKEFCSNCSSQFAEALQHKFCHLSAQQRQVVQNFLNFNFADSQALLQHLNFSQKQLQQLYQQSQKDNKGWLYVKLGLLFGVMAGVLVW